MDVMDVDEEMDCGIASLWEESSSMTEAAPTAFASSAPTAFASSMEAEALRRTTPLFAANCGDEVCGPACAFIRHGVGNVFHCTVHPGAIHVCDMRCKFREVAVSDTGAISYKCRISGLVTTKRLLFNTTPSAQVNKRGAEEHDEQYTPKAFTGGAFANQSFGQRPRLG
eukprot:COSAG02_NODE_353_length_24023_cov_77.872304_18_plen_169_part_00